MGEPLVVDQVYQSCLVSLDGYDIWVELIILGMIDFDIILSMNLLAFIMLLLIIKLRLSS